MSHRLFSNTRSVREWLHELHGKGADETFGASASKEEQGDARD